MRQAVRPEQSLLSAELHAEHGRNFTLHCTDYRRHVGLNAGVVTGSRAEEPILKNDIVLRALKAQLQAAGAAAGVGEADRSAVVMVAMSDDGQWIATADAAQQVHCHSVDGLRVWPRSPGGERGAPAAREFHPGRGWRARVVWQWFSSDV